MMEKVLTHNGSPNLPGVEPIANLDHATRTDQLDEGATRQPEAPASIPTHEVGIGRTHVVRPAYGRSYSRILTADITERIGANINRTRLLVQTSGALVTICDTEQEASIDRAAGANGPFCGFVVLDGAPPLEITHTGQVFITCPSGITTLSVLSESRQG